MRWLEENYFGLVVFAVGAVCVACVVLVLVVMPVLILLGVDVSIHNNQADGGNCPALSDCSAYIKH